MPSKALWAYQKLNWKLWYSIKLKMRKNECFMGATFSDPNLGMALEMALATQESRYKD